MHEELFYENELIEKTSHSKILLAKHPKSNMIDIEAKINEIIDIVDEFDNEKLKLLLKNLTPSIENKQNNIISFTSCFYTCFYFTLTFNIWIYPFKYIMCNVDMGVSQFF